MNSSRKRPAHGFRLESLTKIAETKSQDKQQTLLSYIAHVVEKVFPNVLTFYEDLELQDAYKGISHFCRHIIFFAFLIYNCCLVHGKMGERILALFLLQNMQSHN